MKNIYNFVNEPLKNKFNPSFNYYIYENILELNFQKLKQDILSLEKNMVKKYPNDKELGNAVRELSWEQSDRDDNSMSTQMELF